MPEAARSASNRACSWSGSGKAGTSTSGNAPRPGNSTGTVIVTSNLPIRWGETLSDDVAAAAIDPLVHRAHVIALDATLTQPADTANQPGEQQPMKRVNFRSAAWVIFRSALTLAALRVWP